MKIGKGAFINNNRSKTQLFRNNELMAPILKLIKMKGLVFVLFEDKKNGYRAFESRHSIMITAKSRPELIEEIKKDVNKRFGGKFYGKIVLREVMEEEIKISSQS